MSGVYVVVVLGEAASVLTELLWWVCVRERRPVAGIEVWTTRRGADLLRALVGGPAYTALQDVTGPLPGLAPAGAPPSASYGFRIHTFDLGGRELDDVRTREEASVVNAVLHDRIRQLRAALPDTVPLLGCLAGGRKTLSAALQTAFTLQARRADRLVHTIIDGTLEAALRRDGQLDTFVCPSPAWAERTGVPVDAQVIVHDVPFPRLQLLVPRRLSEVLRDRPWGEVWPVLDADPGRGAFGRLCRTTVRHYVYEVIAPSGRVLYERRLVARVGAVFAAMASQTSATTAADLLQWLDDHEAGWRPPPPHRGEDPLDETRQARIRAAVTTLRRQLSDLPLGLERFAPAPVGFAVRDVDVDHVWRPLGPRP